jgi:hypothetical protein
MRSQGEVQFVAHDTGLNPDAAGIRVDGHNPGQVTGNIHHDALANDLAGQGCTSGSRDNGCSMFTGKPDECANVILGSGERHSQRHLTINGGIGRIERPHRRIEMEISFEFGR